MGGARHPLHAPSSERLGDAQENKGVARVSDQEPILSAHVQTSATQPMVVVTPRATPGLVRRKTNDARPWPRNESTALKTHGGSPAMQ